MTLSAEVEDASSIAYYLEGLAAIAASEDRLARAARLWGAAEALLQTTEVVAYAHAQDRYSHESQVAAARIRLDQKTWAQAWAEGRAMMTEEAVAYSLGKAPYSGASTRL